MTQPTRLHPTRGPRRRAAVALVALVAVAVALAGCGVRSDVAGQAVQAAASPAFLADSAERTAAAETGRMALTVSFSGMPGVGDAQMTGEGAFDTPARRASMRIDMSELAGLAGVSGPETDAVFAEPMEFVMDGDVVYIRMPLLAEMAGGTTDWVRTDAGALGAGQAGGLGVGPEAADPRALVEFLRGAGGEVTTVGTEDVRGVPTTHLHTVVSPEDIVAEVAPEQRERVEAALEGVDPAATGIDSLPVDVWVDADGMVRRFTIAVQVPAEANEGQPAEVQTTVELFDFDEPVEIVVPPADQVTDMSELSGLFGGDTGD